MRYIIIILFLFSVRLCHSQTQEPAYRHQLKISLIRLINPLNRGIELSYEHQEKSTSATQLSLGLPANPSGVDAYKKITGFSAGIQQKFYRKVSKTSARYFSADFTHNSRKFNETIVYWDPSAGADRVDSFTVKSKTDALSLNFGKQYYINHFVFEFSIGAGAKYRNVKHYDRTAPFPVTKHEPFDFIADSKTEKQGFAFIIPINLRIGYRF